MNFLAHAHLSPPQQPLLLCGNTLGDFIKAPLKMNLPAQLSRGVFLHRAIDSYTDTHPSVRQARSYLFDHYRHYSRVLVDVYYDHFLAADFRNYADLPLKTYSQEVYRILSANEALLPAPARELARAMQAGNWLLGYGRLEGIDQACQGMARRHGGNARILVGGMKSLKMHYQPLQATFRAFYPQLRSFTLRWLKNELAT